LITARIEDDQFVITLNARISPFCPSWAISVLNPDSVSPRLKKGSGFPLVFDNQYAHGRATRIACNDYHDVLIWTPPDVQGLCGVMKDRLGCRFISGLLCKP
jgi:hypothetical protein